MPKVVRPLTRKEILAKAKQDKGNPNKRNDGNNLTLLVYLSGKRSWRTRYTLNGKVKEWIFADYDDVQEVEARKLNNEFQKLAKQGIDPKQASNADKQTQKLTFQYIANELLEKRKLENKKDKENTRRLKKHIFPIIGNIPHHQVTKQIMQEQIINPLIDRGVYAEAKKTFDVLKLVFNYAINEYEKIDSNPTLKLWLPSYKATPFHAITEETQFKQLLVDIWALPKTHPRTLKQTIALLKLSVMFFLRPSEIRCLKWADYDEKEQVIQAYASKVDLEHAIILPKQAIAILEDLKEYRKADNEYIFANNRIADNNPLSEGACRTILKKLGYQGKQTMHGMRATARTIADEELGLPIKFLESQLTHQNNDPNKGSYNRSQYKRQRGQILQVWANYIETLCKGENVEHFKFDYKPNEQALFNDLLKSVGKDKLMQMINKG